MVLVRLNGRLLCVDKDSLARLVDSIGPQCYLIDSCRIVTDFGDASADQCLQVRFRLRGGKGGFGTNLRAQGAKLSHKKRAGQYESARDLETGARLRDIQRARVVKEWASGSTSIDARFQDLDRVRKEGYRRRLEQRIEKQERLLGAVSKKDVEVADTGRRAARTIEDALNAEPERATVSDKGKERLLPQRADPATPRTRWEPDDLID